jgi:predicted dehydrogenase
LRPRFRLLGSKAAYVKWHLDIQEEVLRAGGRPGGADWGVEPPERWGEVVTGATRRVVVTEAGAYQQFYRALVLALRGEIPVPVDPEDAVAALDVIEAAQRSAASGRVVEMGQ